MLIDWFTVGAQLVNFLVLVWLLKRFLYQPVLDAVDAREQRIATAFADAEKKASEAAAERNAYAQKRDEIEQQRASLISAAQDEAKSERHRMLTEARQVADDLSARRIATLQKDIANLNHAISEQTRLEVFSIVRKVLLDMASVSLEERLAGVFLDRLRNMDAPLKACIVQALSTTSEPALLRCAFDLPEAQRISIQRALNETFSADVAVRFEVVPDIVAGVEFSVNGQKLSWSIDDYLVTLEQRVDQLLKESGKVADDTEGHA